MVLRGFLFTNEDFTLSWLISADLIRMRYYQKRDSGSSHCRPPNKLKIKKKLLDSRHIHQV